MRILDVKSLKTLFEKYQLGIGFTRNQKIWFNNIAGVRKEGIKYSHSYAELEEYHKCKKDPIYFIESYCMLNDKHIVLRDYQKDIVLEWTNTRFILIKNSRQMGVTLIVSLLQLYNALFNQNENNIILTQKKDTSRHILTNIKEIYKTIPFFLQVGVSKYNENEICFENKSKIRISSLNEQGSAVSFLFWDCFNWCNETQAEQTYKHLIPSFTQENAKVIIQCGITALSTGFFKNFITNACQPMQSPEWNQFKPITLYWWMVDGRDLSWKDNMINRIGEDSWYKEYETH